MGNSLIGVIVKSITNSTHSMSAGIRLLLVGPFVGPLHKKRVFWVENMENHRLITLDFMGIEEIRIRQILLQSAF